MSYHVRMSSSISLPQEETDDGDEEVDAGETENEDVKPPLESKLDKRLQVR